MSTFHNYEKAADVNVIREDPFLLYKNNKDIRARFYFYFIKTPPLPWDSMFMGFLDGINVN